MTKHYFSATHHACDNDVSFICSYQRAMKPKEWLIVDLGYPYSIVTAQVTQPLDELKVLTSKEQIFQAICVPPEIKVYEEKMKNQISAQTILNQMEEMNREVALLEKCKKNAGLNPKYGELWEAYQKLMSKDTGNEIIDFE